MFGMIEKASGTTTSRWLATMGKRGAQARLLPRRHAACTPSYNASTVQAIMLFAIRPNASLNAATASRGAT